MKKKVLGISGSAGLKSTNTLLLNSIAKCFSDSYDMEIIENLSEFPLFTPERSKGAISTVIADFKSILNQSDLVILSTPEYNHSIPAVLKNMFEWCSESGEFNGKKMIVITFTPSYPRGEYAMKSLGFILQSMQASVQAELSFFFNECERKENELCLPDSYIFVLNELLRS